MANDNDNLIQNLMSMLGDNPSEKLGALLGALSTPKEEPKEAPKEEPPPSGNPVNDLFGGMDIGSLLKMQNTISSLGGQSDERSKLLEAIKPFLNNQRKPQVDQALRLLKLTKLAQTANELNLFKDFKL